MTPALIYRKAWSSVDRLTDSLTSYRLVYYLLWVYVGWAAMASLLGLGRVSAKWYDIILSSLFLIVVCWTVNELLARYLNIAKNQDSYAITALILSLIFQPATKLSDFAVLAAAGTIAIASKFLLSWRRSHIFNPAAFAALLLGLLFHKYASWWVGTSVMTPLVFVGGWLILRKMKRFTLVTVFLATYFGLMLIHIWNGSTHQAWHQVWQTLIDTQILFFAYVMLTEPMTSPTTKEKYLPYAAVVGLCYGSLYWHIGSWQPTFSPEQALIIGNIFAAIIAFSPRYPLKLRGKIAEAQEITSFVFSRPVNFKFKAGQYMEWTLPASKSDLRGNRRYLTIASSPTEDSLMVTLRMPAKKSWYKTELETAKDGSLVLASRLAGSFTLPKDKSKKLAFLAGGVGITPFRSMIKYMLDSGDLRDSSLIYAVTSPKEIAFRELLASAKSQGIRTFAVVAEPPSHWGGLKGRVDEKIIKQALPDYKDRLFYISGPLPFVSAMEGILIKIGVPSRNIKTDYFPGYG